MVFARYKQAMMIVYIVTNKLNGKRYVGMTSRSLEVRWNEHKRAATKDEPEFYISRSMRKHGAENFDIQVIEECASCEALVEAEKAWIASLGTFGPGGYNLTAGGEGTPGRVTSEATKKLLSEIAKARPPATAEHRKNISIANSGENNAFFGKGWGRHGPLSIEAKKKMSIAHTGKTLTEEHKKNIGLAGIGRIGPNLGKIFDDSVRTKMSMSRKFPVDVFAGDVHLCTCLSRDDACELFRPSGMSVRKMHRMIRAEQIVGTHLFVQQQKCIAAIRLELEKA